MIISHKYKFICLNAPKTGTGYREAVLAKGNSDINNWTDKSGIRHYNVEYTLKYLKDNSLEDKCKDYFWFSFARNPWERMESWFNMQIKAMSDEELNNLTPEDFSQAIVDDYLNYSNGTRKFNGSLETYLIKNGKPLDFIGKLENTSEDLKFISKRLKLQLNFEPKTGRYSNLPSRHSIIRNLWTEDSINFIREKEKFVIDLMKYEFPEDL